MSGSDNNYNERRINECIVNDKQAAAKTSDGNDEERLTGGSAGEQ
jgi:hypothetical protein